MKSPPMWLFALLAFQDLIWLLGYQHVTPAALVITWIWNLF